MDHQQAAYKVEAYELLSELETSLLELEQTPDNKDLVDRVFRAMHTIKGSGAMFGFDEIAAFTHDVETVFDRVRDGHIPVTTHLVNLALSARDQIKAMLDGTADADRGTGIIEGFRALPAPAADTAPAAAAPATADPEDRAAAAGDEQIFRICFAPHADLFASGTNPLALLDELAELGSCRVVAHTDRLPEPAAFDPEQCYLRWDVLLSTDQGLDAVKDVFIFAEDGCDLSIDLLAQGPAADDALPRLGEILVARGDVTPAMVEKVVQEQKRLGQLLVDAQAVRPEQVCAALAEQQFLEQTRRKCDPPAAAASVRVAAEKLDALVNLVGELVTVQARLSQKAVTDRDPELLAITEVVERLTAELRDHVLSVRMLPIETAFTKLRRLVRDLSGELGKSIELHTEGGETELDKTVIEQLNDPLVHILRNSIDHGIETPEQRRAAGKPPQGTIRIQAEHSGANVLIRIADDGAGIDPERIRAKAVAKGLLASDAEKSDKELLQMVFLPGFSTAGTVTSVSGRGVGMDVVKRSLEALRGGIEINSEKDRGTTITLKLPLTLAIIDGLLVQIGAEKFVLPLASVEACVELTRQDVADAHGRNILNIRDRLVPYIPLRERFAVAGAPPAIEQVVINQVDDHQVGIVVDRVIGEHQIVIKTMNTLYKDVQEISGATILGDGTVALILDVQQLIHGLDQAA
ncbi:chemotaxis protein CheA [Desulfatitalea alkaliphila]|uniref:Chemotaxis protein CheA n=1 Tax=Desulfatitalea alkaliphila TaxID=2929485 RepID=A0AA41R1D5_9BACT|nr:chemotaxis protein CheA [Desulfatitalea alkaliphila]MCJ8500362.1 chemotaxis protein CheA [Desulfatitalea alkaliphila]